MIPPFWVEVFRLAYLLERHLRKIERANWKGIFDGTQWRLR